MIREKLKEKRNLRKQWQYYRSPKTKSRLNKAIKNLKKLLGIEKNAGIQMHLRNFSPSKTSDYTLWKATKKQPQQISLPITKQNGYRANSDQEKADHRTSCQDLHS
jgi:hypothetical protein